MIRHKSKSNSLKPYAENLACNLREATGKPFRAHRYITGRNDYVVRVSEHGRTARVYVYDDGILRLKLDRPKQSYVFKLNITEAELDTVYDWFSDTVVAELRGLLEHDAPPVPLGWCPSNWNTTRTGNYEWSREAIALGRSTGLLPTT